MRSDKPLQQWTVQDVVNFLEDIELHTITQQARENALTGEDLINLTQDELQHDLGITRLQARKIKLKLNLPASASTESANGTRVDTAGAVPAVSASTAANPDLDRAISAGKLQRPLMPSVPSAPPVATGIPVTHSHQPPVQQAVLVDPTIAKQWGETMHNIARLESEQVALRLPAAQERLAGLKQRADAERKKLQQLHEELRKHDQSVKKLEDGDWYLGKGLLGKAHHEKKVEKARDEQQDVRRKVEASAGVLEQLNSKVDVHTKEVQELSQKVAALSSMKLWEANLLPHLFDGSAGDPRENQLEREYQAMAPKLQEVRVYKQRYSQALELVRNGRKQLDDGTQLLQTSLGLGQVDMMMEVMSPGMGFYGPPQPGGMMIDMVKHAQMQQAAQLIQAACESVSRALEIIPDMPRVDKKRVDGLMGMGLIDIFAQNVFISMMVQMQIQEAMGAAQAMLQDVIYAERWLQGWIENRINQDLRAAEAAYAAKKAELDAARRDILQRAVYALQSQRRA